MLDGLRMNIRGACGKDSLLRSGRVKTTQSNAQMRDRGANKTQVCESSMSVTTVVGISKRTTGRLVWRPNVPAIRLVLPAGSHCWRNLSGCENFCGSLLVGCGRYTVMESFHCQALKDRWMSCGRGHGERRTVQGRGNTGCTIRVL